jgi:hypothetical protein
MKQIPSPVSCRTASLAVLAVLLIAAGCKKREGTVFFVAGDKLYRLNINDQVVTNVCSGLPKTEDVALDVAQNRLLLSTWNAGSPVLAFDTLKGKEAAVRHNGPGDCGQGLAYDAASSNLFYGLYYGGVYAKNEQGEQGWRQLVAASALAPMIGQRGQLVLDPAHRLVYFRSAFNGDCDRCRFIWRVNYDGSNPTKIVRANGGDALAIDVSAGHLYYSDEPGNGVLKRVNVDGTVEQTILNLPPPYNYCIRMALDVPGKKIYLYLANMESNWRNRAIARVSLNGADFEILTEVGGVGEGAGGIAFSTR